jgi:hypothetical protein
MDSPFYGIFAGGTIATPIRSDRIFASVLCGSVFPFVLASVLTLDKFGRNAKFIPIQSGTRQTNGKN